MFTDELRDTFAERFGEKSLSQTVPHWQLGWTQMVFFGIAAASWKLLQMKPRWIAAIVQGDYGLYMALCRTYHSLEVCACSHAFFALALRAAMCL